MAMSRIVALFMSFVILAMFLLISAVPMAFAQNAQEQINSGLCAGANLDITNPNCGGDTGATTKINDIIRTIINLLSVAVGVVAVIMIIVGGLRYITSGGSDTSVTGAKNTILYAIIGLIIVALAQILVRFVLSKVTQT